MNDIAASLPAVPAKWVKYMAQVGLTAKAVLYCLLGALALFAALQLGEPASDVSREGVLLLIEDLFLGKLLLTAEAAGLACYCLWRLLQTLKDTEGKGTTLKGLAYRARFGASGFFYGLLTLLALKLAMGSREDEEGLRQAVTLYVLQRPLGPSLLFVVAAAITLAGGYHVYQGISGKYRKKIKESGWKNDGEEAMIWAGKVGYSARGIVWGIVGYLLFQTALHAKAGATGRNVFKFLENLPYGTFLMGGISLGLICYGLFVFMEARFRNGKSH